MSCLQAAVSDQIGVKQLLEDLVSKGENVALLLSVSIVYCLS